MNHTTAMVGLRLPTDLIEDIDNEAEREEMTRSQVIRKILKREFSKQLSERATVHQNA